MRRNHESDAHKFPGAPNHESMSTAYLRRQSADLDRVATELPLHWTWTGRCNRGAELRLANCRKNRSQDELRHFIDL
jgi:hypothetical protein